LQAIRRIARQSQTSQRVAASKPKALGMVANAILVIARSAATKQSHLWQQA
jgi:hypothetical protein